MTAMRPQTAPHNTPDLKVVTFKDQPGLVERVIGKKRQRFANSAKSLDYRLAIDGGNDHITLYCISRSINDQQVTVVDTTPNHAVAMGTHQIGMGCLDLKQMVQRYAFLDVVLGGTGKACRNAIPVKREG